jgi:hypothetical protein
MKTLTKAPPDAVIFGGLALAIAACVIGLVLSSPAGASARPAVVTSTGGSWTVPPGASGTWAFRLWVSGTEIGDPAYGTAGATLSVVIPEPGENCHVQADVRGPNGKPQPQYDAQQTFPTCGPVTTTTIPPTTTTTAPTTTTTEPCVHAHIAGPGGVIPTPCPSTPPTTGKPGGGAGPQSGEPEPSSARPAPALSTGSPAEGSASLAFTGAGPGLLLLGLIGAILLATGFQCWWAPRRRRLRRQPAAATSVYPRGTGWPIDAEPDSDDPTPGYDL